MSVMLAKAGICLHLGEVPAFAGMTFTYNALA